MDDKRAEIGLHADPRKRALALDALRGIAALAVVAHHVAYEENIPFLFGHAFLAVDLFFVMSGVVIGRAYEPALRSATMSFGQYVKVRLVRLYPTIALGALVGFAAVLILGLSLRFPLWEALLAQLLFIPLFGVGFDVFLLNGVQWSLFFELAANFVHAAFAKWLTTPVLALVVIIALPLYIFSVFFYQTGSTGPEVSNFLGGFPRVAYSFAVGLLINRLASRGTLRIPKLPFLPLALVVFAVLAAPLANTGRLALTYDVIAVSVVIPCLVALATVATVPAWAVSGALWLGAISYPLYALHYPLLRMMSVVISTPGTPALLKLAGWATIVLACVAIAWAVNRWFEPQARRLLSRRLPRLRRADA